MSVLDQEMENKETFEDMEIDNDIYEDDEDSDIATLGENQYYVYAIIDKDIPGLTQYFRDYGINLSKVYTNIELARDTLIMQTEQSKLVVIETGSGKFASMSARKSLVDLIGIGDENSDIIVFYKDSIIKNEVYYNTDSNTKDIDWVKYRSIPQVLATLLQKKGKNEYIIDSEYENINELKFSLDSKGLKDTKYKYMDVGSVNLDVASIAKHVVFEDKKTMDERYTAIEAFKVEI